MFCSPCRRSFCGRFDAAYRERHCVSEIQRLRDKLKHWNELLVEGRPNAIEAQIGRMLWFSAFYRSVNLSRKYLQQDAKGKSLANGALHDLLHEGYVTMHCSAVRRLIDIRKDANSLVRLIEDIHKHSALLTRENMLAARDLSHADTHAQQAQGALCIAVQCWHDLCDELCGVHPDKRQPTDCPKPKKFSDLINGVNTECIRIVRYTNHNIAHTPRKMVLKSCSSDDNGPDDDGLSLAILWRAERVLVRAASFISRCVVTGTDIGGVATPQFDVFRCLNLPFVSKDALPILETEWEMHHSEIERCRGWSWDQELVSEEDAWE